MKLFYQAALGVATLFSLSLVCDPIYVENNIVQNLPAQDTLSVRLFDLETRRTHSKKLNPSTLLPGTVCVISFKSAKNGKVYTQYGYASVCKENKDKVCYNSLYPKGQFLITDAQLKNQEVTKDSFLVNLKQTGNSNTYIFEKTILKTNNETPWVVHSLHDFVTGKKITQLESGKTYYARITSSDENAQPGMAYVDVRIRDNHYSINPTNTIQNIQKFDPLTDTVRTVDTIKPNTIYLVTRHHDEANTSGVKTQFMRTSEGGRHLLETFPNKAYKLSDFDCKTPDDSKTYSLSISGNTWKLSVTETHTSQVKSDVDIRTTATSQTQSPSTQKTTVSHFPAARIENHTYIDSTRHERPVIQNVTPSPARCFT